MNKAEKLRFIADRVEDEKEFNSFRTYVYKFIDSELLVVNDLGEYQQSILWIDDLLRHDLKLKPQWSFTEDEKVILRNISEQHKWITRDKSGDITIYSTKPYKSNGYWVGSQTVYSFQQLTAFKHLFQSIQWEDDKPCEFRRYL